MENRTLTLGSLFDGSGGFPLGGTIAGIYEADTSRTLDTLSAAPSPESNQDGQAKSSRFRYGLRQNVCRR